VKIVNPLRWRTERSRRAWVRLLPVLLVLAWPGPTAASVELAFHSHAMSSSFPHALIVLRGTVDATGERVDTNYGFTVRHQIGPSVLFGPVQGVVMRESRDYVRHTRRHFSLTLTDEEYRRVRRLIDRWRALPQPSYRLDQRNCVSFVAAVAAELGLRAEIDPATTRRPRAYLDSLWVRNRRAIEGRMTALNRVVAER
jgi:hypothetical protein